MLVFLLLLSSCNQKKTFDSEKDLWGYIKESDNGYYHEKTLGDIKYQLTYRPTDIMVKQELRENFEQKVIDSLRKKYENYLYFTLSMSAYNQELLNTKAGNRNEFGALVNQLAFKMGEKVHLITQKRDTIPMTDYVYPRMYGMSRSTDLLLVYPKDSKALENDFFFFTVEDLGFKTGEISFKIKTDALIKQPELNFNKI